MLQLVQGLLLLLWVGLRVMGRSFQNQAVDQPNLRPLPLHAMLLVLQVLLQHVPSLLLRLLLPLLQQQPLSQLSLHRQLCRDRSYHQPLR